MSDRPSYDDNDRTTLLGSRGKRNEDAHMIRRALREGWPIPEGLHEMISKQAAKQLADAASRGDNRQFLLFARLHLDIDARNLERAKIVLAAERLKVDRDVMEQMGGAVSHDDDGERGVVEFINDLRERAASRERLGADDSGRGNGDGGGNGSSPAGASPE